jgi:hypothetical protein
MTGSGYRVCPKDGEGRLDGENRLGVTHRVQVNFRSPVISFQPALYRQADLLLKSGSFAYLLVDYGLAAVYGRGQLDATGYR